MDINTKFITAISDKFSPSEKFHIKDYNDFSLINSLSINFHIKAIDIKLKFF